MCVLWDELYGTENIRQVHGIITDWLSTLTEKSRERLRFALYDDMCHLSRFARVSIFEIYNASRMKSKQFRNPNRDI